MTTSPSPVAERMRQFAGTTARRAPLYARLAAGLAEQPAVLSILAEAPATHRLPVTLFAAVHDLLLADPSVPLAAWYPNLTPSPRADDPVPAFVAFCASRRDELAALVAARVPQTNEIGRSSLFVAALGHVAAGGRPLAQLDVGASAGLNLLLEHYGYDFSGHRLGGDRLVLECRLRNGRSELLPPAPPRFARHLGLDRDPVDLTDPAQLRWLEACVWPDQTDRFERLRAAIGIALEVGVEVRQGDAVAGLPALVAELGEWGHPVVTTSWVLSYLTDSERAQFVATLDELGRTCDLSWVYAEAPHNAPGLPYPGGYEESPLTILGVVNWQGGRRTVTPLATCHQHGYSLQWL